MILVAVAMIAIIAMAALSIDVVTLYLARMEAQRSADAGALAAARVIALSGITGDPNNVTGLWTTICGGAGSVATQAATAAASQNLIGAVAPLVVVNYHGGGTTSPDCSGLPAAFGVNPIVTVLVTRTTLPTFFSRIWSTAGNTVNAFADAEAFNSSNSGNVGNAPDGTIIPVQPRCVKPWLIPNLDPLNPNPNGDGTYCGQQDPQNGRTTPCNSLVSLGNGAIVNPGISLNGLNANGVIGETLWLSPDCHHDDPTCMLRQNPPEPNYYPKNGNGIYYELPPSLQYLPGQAPSSVVAVPFCSSGGSLYEQAIAGCDQQTVYQCGVQNTNYVDLSENPGIYTNDTMDGVQCLINQDDPNPTDQPSGEDTINTTSYPFQVLAGASNPLIGYGVTAGTPVTSSASVVSLPIYDSAGNAIQNNGGLNTITIVGFLQVFINYVDQNGNVYVTVLNVTGCSNGQGQPVGTAVTGSSPVPVRLITPP